MGLSGHRRMVCFQEVGDKLVTASKVGVAPDTHPAGKYFFFVESP